MGLCGSYGVGQYSSVTTEAHQAVWDRAYVPAGTARSALWLHSMGAGNVGAACEEPWLPSNNSLPLLRAIASLGVPILSADCGRDGVGGTSTTHWANDNSQSRTTDARAFSQSASYLKTSSGKSILIGVSGGATLALNWAKNNPTLVQALILFYGAVNLQAIHDGTGGATAGAASIEAAYGGSLAGWNAAQPTHDPSATGVPSGFAQFPIYFGMSDSDTTVGTANQTAFIAAVGGTNMTVRTYVGAGHADMTKPDVNDVTSFVKQYV